MQSTSLQFEQLAKGDVRPLSYQLRASFDKAFDPDVTLFTLDQSVLDGPDVLASADSNIITEWDKYDYKDYSDRVISIEVNRELTEPDSVVQAYADVVLRNEDDYFTPNSGSPIDQYILPRRPFRLFLGFGGETVPVFVGLSEKIPTIDKKSGTASFHLMDFLTFIFEQIVDQTTMLLDNSTGEILDYLFQEVGLLPDQYELDQTSFNRVPFFYVEKGDKLGPIVRELMQAEQGRLYMDELGIIRFTNRQNYSTTPVYDFSKANVTNYHVSDEDDVINSVKITCDIYDVMPEQSIWELAEVQYIPIGASVDVWADLPDPTTTITDPIYSAEQIEQSYFTGYEDTDRLIPYAGIDLDSITKFSKAVKMTFTNSGSTNAYLTNIDLWGTPVRVVDTIIVEDSDPASIEALEERRFEMTAKYLQDSDSAVSKAAILIDDYKDYGSIVSFDAKGNPALQIGDILDLDLDGYTGNHATTKITQGMSDGQYWQRLTAKAQEFRIYFVLDVSELNGTDVLAP